ncbi:ABC transporter ATP-binding protein [Paenibacillus filicis]|uniref:ABC transporter ATP-binding protein n=1 Tax=Paenibacillus filicis TaxID=669464 RepID=A0ABU9DE87_9BACL
MTEIREETAIEARGVVKRFGGKAAVDHVSLQVKRGEFISLLGPSGCGKTTLLRMLGGLEHPDQGVILLGGQDVSAIPAYGRNTNMIFQQLALFPHMDVFNNIAYGLKVKKVPRAEIQRRVAEVLELVQLPEYGSRAITQLSGGQAQRIAIARALVNKPDVLLLDEPLSALDMQLRLDMQRELKRIQRESGGTFIFVTHDQGEALNMSDRIGVMRSGSLLQYGTPDEIYERPADSFVAKFIGETNLLPVRVLGAESGRLHVEWHGHRLQVAAPQSGPAAAAGEQGQLSIRFEYIRVGEEAAELPNRTKARVVDTVYGGTMMRYRLVSDDGIELTAHRLHQPGGLRYGIGDIVDIGWRSEDAIYVRDHDSMERDREGRPA